MVEIDRVAPIRKRRMKHIYWKWFDVIKLLCKVSTVRVNRTVQHGTNLVLGRFKDYYANLAGKILKKLLEPPSKFTLNKALQKYYSR